MTSAETIIVAAVAVATPTVTGLIGIVLQRQDVRDLRSDMKDLRSDNRDLRSEMIALRKEIHSDLLLIHERVAKTEARQEGQ